MTASPAGLARVACAVLAVAICATVTPVATAADAPIVIRFGQIAGDTSGNGDYTQDMGYFKAAGLDVHFTTVTSGPVGAQAVASGALDISVGNVATIAAARLRGIPLKFIAPAEVSNESTQTDVIMVAKDSPYKTAADLNGKTFAINAIKALPQVSASSWMDKHGGDAKTVKFLEIGFPQMGAALEAHRVDAALVVEPFASANKAFARSLGSAIDGLAPRVMIVGYFASDAWLATHAEAASKFVAALKQGSEWANTHRRESAVILSKYTKIDVGVINSMARAEYGLTLEPAVIQPIVDSAVKYGVIEKSVPMSELLWKTPTP